MSLWGFGPNPKKAMPSISEVDRVLSSTGYGKIKILNNTIKKNHPLVKIDLNAIAKGYAVDQVFKYIQDKGFDNIFVEIGGEVRSSGRNSHNNYWSIGIENPHGGEKSDKEIAAIVDLDNNRGLSALAELISQESNVPGNDSGMSGFSLSYECSCRESPSAIGKRYLPKI